MKRVLLTIMLVLIVCQSICVAGECAIAITLAQRSVFREDCREDKKTITLTVKPSWFRLPRGSKLAILHDIVQRIKKRVILQTVNGHKVGGESWWSRKVWVED